MKTAFRSKVALHETNPGELGLMLKDCHVRDDDYLLKYRKVRGKKYLFMTYPKALEACSDSGGQETGMHGRGYRLMPYRSLWDLG